MTDTIKPVLNFTIVCDDIRQEMGGKISLMGLFENIYAAQFPAIHPRLAILNEWTEGKGEFGVRLQILAPDRKTVLRETASRMKLNEAHHRHREISIHLNIEFKAPGTYWIESSLDGEVIKSFPLSVIRVKEPQVH